MRKKPPSSKLGNSVSDEYSSNAPIILHPGAAENFTRTIPDNSIALVVTSPPYNLGKEYEDREDMNEYLDKQRETIVELHRALKDNGSICWQVGNYIKNGEVFPLDIFYYRIFKELGMFLRNRIVWRYGHGQHASNRFSGRYETILWFTKSETYLFNLDNVRVPAKYPGKLHSKGPKKGKPSGNPKGKNPSDVWEVVSRDWENGFWEIPNVKSSHREKTIHPCQFPIELAERCVLALTNVGDFVFDPYSGVGSSLIAAIKHKRRAIGSEKEEVYVKVTRERIEHFFQGKLNMRPLGKSLYEPGKTEKVAQIPKSWVRDESTIYYDGNEK